MNKKIIVLIIIFVVSVIISFYLGNRFSLSKKTQIPKNSFGKFQMDKGSDIGGRVMMNKSEGKSNTGEILSIDDKSITLKLRDGGSKIIFYTNKTNIQKMTDGTITDLVIGKQISVNGENNLDGSINAENIQIRPSFEVNPKE